MVEDTESPRLFHVWSAISAIAAALGRRCYLPFGPMVIYPNIYTLLVGNPGTRKSTAGSMMKRLLKQSTGVRFAPTDTGGQRQGLVTAMLGKGEDQQKAFLEGVELTGRDDSLRALTLDEVAEISDETPEDHVPTSAADKHHLMVVMGEITSLLGQNNHGMLDFLTQMWDGDDYDYGLKSSSITLKDPLLNIHGCTTPVNIAHSMPPGAGGQGFLSRVILVYGARKYKMVPRPAAPELELVSRVKDAIQRAYYEIDGAFEETAEALAYSKTLYEYNLEISDSRFGYYNERRYTHLIKLAMCLAAARGTSLIIKEDYAEAHRILRATERGMPDALGEFGLNPLAHIKQQILENIRENKVIDLAVLQAQFLRDAKSQEISDIVNELVRTNQIMTHQNKSGVVTVHARQQKDDTENTMMSLLSEK